MDPDRVSLLASPMDWVNQIAGLQDSNALLSMVAILERPLPAMTLRHAVGQLLRRHPILASQFIESDPPVWSVPKSTTSRYEHLHESSADIQSVEEWLAEYLESDDGGNFSVTQCRGQDSCTCLVLSVRHSVTDGSGLKLLWTEFLHACDGNGITETSVVAAPTRQADVLFEALGSPDKWRSFIQTAEERQNEARALLRPHASARPAATGSSGEPARFRISLATRTPDDTDRLLSECRRNHATLTAWLAAEILSTTPGRALQITVDLRRYLAAGIDFGVGNLSGIEIAGFPDIPENPADRNPMAMLPTIGETLRQVLAPFPGVASACLQQSLSRLGYRKTREVLLVAGKAAIQTGIAAPLLSNLGVLPEHTRIADVRIRSCFFLPPAFQPPALLVGASTWNGCLSTCTVTGKQIVPVYAESYHRA